MKCKEPLISNHHMLQKCVVSWCRNPGIILDGKRRYPFGVPLGQLNKIRASHSLHTGSEAGMPDIQLFVEGGRLLLIEVKYGSDGLSNAQKARIEHMGRDLGFWTLTLWSNGQTIMFSPHNGWHDTNRGSANQADGPHEPSFARQGLIDGVEEWEYHISNPKQQESQL